MPTWLSVPGPVLLKRHIRTSKTDPLVDEVQLLQANPQYAHIQHADGREAMVSIRHLAPCGDTPLQDNPLTDSTALPPNGAGNTDEADTPQHASGETPTTTLPVDVAASKYCYSSCNCSNSCPRSSNTQPILRL